MKPFLVLFILIAVVVGGSITWLAMADVPVEQTEVVKTIPNETFFTQN